MAKNSSPSFTAASLLSPAQLSGAGATGTRFVDTAGFESVLVAVNIGALGGTSPTVAVKLQEADAAAAAAASYADVAAADYGLGFGTTAANTMVFATYTGAKRYLRAVITLGGTTPTAFVSCWTAAGAPLRQPASPPTTGVVT